MWQILGLLRTFLSCEDHVKANKIGGWAGTVAAACLTGATLLVETQDSQIQAFCQDPKGYLFNIVIWCFVGIGGTASVVNSATTAALTPKQPPTASPEGQETPVHNSDLERVSKAFPEPRR